jgi:hypothetical protein
MFLILMKICLQCPRKRYVKFSIILARLLKQYFGHLCLKCGYKGKSEIKGSLRIDFDSLGKDFRHLKCEII